MLSHQIIGGNSVNYDTDTKKSMTDKHLKTDQPLDYLLKNEYGSFKEDNRDNMIAVLFCGMLERKQRKMKLITSSNHLRHVYGEKPSIGYGESLGKFMAFLHLHILTPSITPFSKISKLMPKELFDHDV